MDRAVVGPAHQGQIRQVGGAAMEPVPQMVGVAPGQGPFTVGEDTAPVPHGQGGALAGLDDPGGPADLQRLGRGPTRIGGSRVMAAWSRAASRSVPLRWWGWGGGAPLGWWGWGGAWAFGSWVWDGAWPLGSGSWSGSGWWWPGCWRVTRTRVTAPSQA